MAKSKGTGKRATKKEATPEAPPPKEAAPVAYNDEDAEREFIGLPGRIDETMAVVRYTGRKRAYIHYGRAGDGLAFWYLIRSDGPRLLKVYPPHLANECYTSLLEMMAGWRASVDSSPMSDSYCEICPDESVVELVIRSRYLTDFA
ncbi:hypothetical protein [Zavarzinella formosa]|uniref:hypothetical protein n=1 Tax=Zavarzinella formosa TaxID=360055 RepID=UPI00030C91A7|nr:hypothetical protein [Zavarzinella formosa]